MAKRAAPSKDDEHWKLAEHITRFVNNAFGRRLRPSRALYDAIRAAAESGYSSDEMRTAFWVARCLSGDQWLKEVLQNDMSPEIVLRHKGGINPKTGSPSKRWLDELLARASETNSSLVVAILGRLPEDMRAGEDELLDRMEVTRGVQDEH